jgi:hypothetical protein
VLVFFVLFFKGPKLSGTEDPKVEEPTRNYNVS